MDKRTLLHFLRSFLSLLLALLLLLVPLYAGCISLFEKRQLALTAETLQNGMSRLDQQITGLSGIASSIGQDASYRTLALRDPAALTPAEYYSLNTLHAEFRRLCLAQPYVKDYALLFRNHILFSKERVHMAKEPYYGTFVTFEGMDEQAFFETFGSPAAASMFLKETTIRMTRNEGKDAYRAVTWLCSMSQIYSKRPCGVFFATLPSDTLAALLMPGLTDEEAGFTLSAKNGETLMRYGQLENAEKSAHRISAVAAQTGLTATLFLSDTLFTGMMSPIRNFLLYCIAGLTVGGLLISASLAWRASRPISRLVSLVHQAGNAVSYQADARDSFELIGNAVTGLNSSVDAYRDALSKQQQNVREHVFETLLRETPVQDGAADRRHMQEFAVCFPHFPARYRLCLIQLAGQEEECSLLSLSKRQVLLCGLIKAQLSPEPYVFVSGRRAVAVLSEDASTDVCAQLEQMKRVAKEKCALPMLIALSEEGEGCEALHALYVQGKDILRLAAASGTDAPISVWQKQNFPDQPEGNPLDYTEMAQLHTALLHGEKDAALSLLSNVRARLTPASFLDVVMTRQVFYNIRGVLLRVKLERFEPLLAVDIPDYHGEVSEDKQFDALRDCCAAICERLKPLTEAAPALFSGAVCRFIDEHLGDSALCAAMVADRFGISEPTLQKVVRQEKNCSFFDYVAAGRYQLALTLLKTTDKPIAEISALCGYNSTNSFYKAFKRLSPLSPSAIRQEARG